MSIKISGYRNRPYPHPRDLIIMLTFTCDYCEEKYPAEVGLHNKINYESDKNKRHWIEKESDPCFNCMAEVEKAKQEALEKRKKKV